jgi:hypothetical protein
MTIPRRYSDWVWMSALVCAVWVDDCWSMSTRLLNPMLHPHPHPHHHCRRHHRFLKKEALIDYGCVVGPSSWLSDVS